MSRVVSVSFRPARAWWYSPDDSAVGSCGASAGLAAPIRLAARPILGGKPRCVCLVRQRRRRLGAQVDRHRGVEHAVRAPSVQQSQRGHPQQAVIGRPTPEQHEPHLGHVRCGEPASAQLADRHVNLLVNFRDVRTGPGTRTGRSRRPGGRPGRARRPGRGRSWCAGSGGRPAPAARRRA